MHFMRAQFEQMLSVGDHVVTTLANEIRSMGFQMQVRMVDLMRNLSYKCDSDKNTHKPLSFREKFK